MAVCEKCGTAFEPKANGEVTTTRVLCPPCTAARLAEKQRAKAAAGKPAAPPAARVSAGAAKGPSPSPAAAAVPARPAPPPPARSKPAPPPALAPKPAAARPPAPKPAPRPRARAVEEEEDDDELTPVRTASVRKRDRKLNIVIWIITGVVAIGAGVVVFLIVSKNQAENRRIEAALAEQQAILDQVNALAAQGTEASAEELLVFADANRPKWEGGDNEADITTLIAKAKNLKEKERVRRETLEMMATVETGLEGLAQRGPDEIGELRRKLGEIEPRAETLGADFLARTGKARTELDRAFAATLLADARSYATENPDKARLALQRYTRAEDEVVQLFDEAIKDRNKENETFYKTLFQETIKESDLIAAAAFPPEVLEKTPWKDLLSGEQVEYWNAAEVKGFSYRIEDGVLTMVGPDPDARNTGLISIGDREQWRDLVIDMQFTLESGTFDLFFRLGGRADGTVPMWQFEAGPEGIVPGKTYEVTAKMIGSAIELTFYPEDIQYEPLQISWTQRRKGALGFQLHEAARLKITRLRVQELRAASN